MTVNQLETAYHVSSGKTRLWQRDRATRLSAEILQLQNIPFKNYSHGPIVWHYLRDPIRLAIFIQYRSVTDTHTHRQTDGQTDT